MLAESQLHLAAPVLPPQGDHTDSHQSSASNDVVQQEVLAPHNVILLTSRTVDLVADFLTAPTTTANTAGPPNNQFRFPPA